MRIFMVKLIKILLSFFILLTFTSVKVFSQDANELQIDPIEARTYNSPEEFFNDFLTQIQTLKDKENLEKYQKFQKWLPIYFDVEGVNRFALGRFGKKLSEEERTTFYSIFSEFFTLTLAFNDYTSAGQLEVTGITTRNKKKQDLHFITTQYSHSNLSKGLEMIWVIKQKKGEAFYKIFDVRIEGISYILSWRSQNESLIRKNGFEGFIQDLTEKTEQLKINLNINNSEKDEG